MSVLSMLMIVELTLFSHNLIDNLAAEGAHIATDIFKAYDCISRRREDVTHTKVNHKNTFKAADGTHTNNAEGVHSVLKSDLRRRYHQIASKNRELGKWRLAIVVFAANARFSYVGSYNLLESIELSHTFYLLGLCVG
ncbi:hypothetical protein FOZ63_003094, partial [Perkinsus olseni]